MNTVYQLELNTPERTPLPDGSFLTNPKEVKSWISALPMANIGETSRLVFKTIVEFNRREIPNVSRIKIAELFRQPIDYISDNLKKYYFEVDFPLSAKHRKIAVLNRELYLELANTYKIFVDEELATVGKKHDIKLLVVALHRALSSLLSVLYHSVIVYEPYPAGIWKEIHQLYAFAERHDFYKLSVRLGSETDHSSTIHNLYSQALLFAVCSPYRLRQREIGFTFEKLPEWASQLSLGMLDDKLPDATSFIADLGSDAPPIHRELRRNLSGKDNRQLNTRRLVSMLKHLQDTLPGDYRMDEPLSSEELVSQYLLQKLVRVLGAAPKRQYVRTRLKFELRTAVGLGNIHALLEQGKITATGSEPVKPTPAKEMDWFEPAPEKPFLSTPLYGSAGHREPSVGLMDSPYEESIVMTGAAPAGHNDSASPIWGNNSLRVPEPFACKTDNESAGGYCALWYGPEAPKIKIGEVLGFQSASDPNQFGIGISRWQKHIPGEGLQVGLEVVSPQSTAVEADLAEPTEFSSGPYRCLLLPAVTRLGQPETLVAPPLSFGLDDKLVVSDGDNRRNIRLTRIQESTGAFVQFQFSPKGGGTSDDDHTEDNMDNDFDSIWDEL